MPSPWLAVGADTDPLARARQLQRSWEHLLAEGVLGTELPPAATAGLRSTIAESWRRSLATGLDPIDLLAPIEVDESDVQERWLEHPLGSVAHVLAAQLRTVADDSSSLVVVTDESGLLLHMDGPEWLKDRAREMNFLEGARYSEAVDGTNGIGTALAANQPLQVFAFEHFNQRHHQWVCSGAPVHDPVSGRIVGLIDLTSLWKIAHPRSLALVTSAARTVERCLLDVRRDEHARLRRRYGDLMTRSTDLLVNHAGYVLDGDAPTRARPLEVPEGGGEIVLGDGSLAVAEPLGQGEAYLVRRPGSPGAKAGPVEAIERAERRARDLAAEQAALRQISTLVARGSSFDQVLKVVADQAARIFDVPLVELVRYEQDGTFVVLGDFSESPGGARGPLGLPVGSRWWHESGGVTELIYRSGRPARVQDYALLAGERAAAMMGSGIRSTVGSPIVVDGCLWGAIVIGSPRPRSFPRDTEARLADFAELVATAIANAESRAAVGRLADEQAALRRVATLVARGASPEETFSSVSHEVGRLFDAEVALARFEPDGSGMVVVGLTEGIPVVSIGTRWKLEDFLASTAVYRTGRPARNDHTGHRSASGQVADSLRQMNFVSTVAAPIVVEGKLWGSLTVNDQRETLPPDTEERVAKFTELVGTAIANAESRAALRQLADEQAALRRVAELVARGVSPDELFRVVSEEVAELFGSEAGVARFKADGSALVFVGLTEGIRGLSVGTSWPLEDFPASSQVYRTGRPARSDPDIWRSVSGPAGDAIRENALVSNVSAPIVVDGKPWGAISVADRRRPLPPDAEERVAKFTDLVATAIANAESHTALGQLAEEQAALRRVAELVAGRAAPGEVFEAVSMEVAGLFGAEAGVARFEPDSSGMVLVGLSEGMRGIPIGTRWPLEDFLACSEVHHTGRPARCERIGWEDASGPAAEALRQMNPVSMVAAPIIVEGDLWGAITVADTRKSLPTNAEERVEKFTELVATAIANAESRAELAASEARAHELAREQAALRRVATRVAREPASEQLLSTVAREVASVLDVPGVIVTRYDNDGMALTLGEAFRPDLAGAERFLGVGTRMPRDPGSLAAQVFDTHGPARVDDFTTLPGTVGDLARAARLGSGCAAPIVVNGAVWGKMCVFSRVGSVLPAGTENRVQDFIELVATAIANYEAHTDLAASEARARELADEQAALRRVATLVARGVSPEEVFSAVTNEMGRLFGSPQAYVGRFEPDGSAMVVVGVSDGIRGVSIGSRWELEDYMASTGVYRTGRPVLFERSDFEHASGPMADLLREIGAVSYVGAPIVVEGRQWGFVTVTDMNKRLSADAEKRLEKFAELLGTAIANADSRAELAASRARIIAATDDARRRIERDLHDGAQQRLVTLTVALRRAEAKIPAGSGELRADLARVAEGLTSAVDELRELSRGIHPSILTEGGLLPALKALGRRSPIRVKLDVGFEQRLPDHVEVAAYYTVSEALTNASKHANATRVWVSVRVDDGLLLLSLRDDGVGGADPSLGSGLTGLRDRIEALGGGFRIESSPGSGTLIEAEIPIVGPAERNGELDELLAQATTPGSGL